MYTEIFSILNKNGLGKGKTDLKTIGECECVVMETRSKEMCRVMNSLYSDGFDYIGL